jgi:putative serine protease PepD
MTETPNIPQQPQTGGHQHQQYWTPPTPSPMPPRSPVPEQPAAPDRPRRLSRGTLAVAATAILVAGALGGTVGALVGSHDAAPAATQTSTAAQTAAATQATDVSAVVAKVLPSVVQVNVTSGNQKGIGSGVVVSSDGKILTNNHVVSGAGSVTVTLSDGRTVNAEVLGTDANSDLAMIQAKNVSGLTAATLGDSDSVKVGDQVIAIGSPAGLQNTVTTGIVSALNREVTVSAEDREQSQLPFSRNGSGSTVTYHAIQTDASINQGNSGGPLFNAAGEVIGINSAIYSPVSGPDGSAGSVGIGFAIPINQAKEVIG